ncbi:MAG: EAL domain-containing protein [Gammaproteobacteria bacterium]|nr:EAL domain-containing protein [Gammaproteobacteria bacterium]
MSSARPPLLSEIMSSAVLTVGPHSRLADAVAMMAERRISCLVVVDARQPLGIVTESDVARLLKRGTSRDTTVHHVMSSPPVTAPAGIDFYAAMALMQRFGIRHLVAVDEKGRLAGIATETDFRSHIGLEVLKRIRDLTAIMEREPPTFHSDTTVSAALSRMLAEGRDYALVADDNVPLGIITERDLPALLARAVDIRGITLADIMSPARTVRADIAVPALAEEMTVRGIRHAIVVDFEGRLVGVVTQHQLIERLSRNLFEAGWAQEREDREDLESHLELVLETAGVGVWKFDHALGRFLWSPILCSMLGYYESQMPTSIEGWLGLVHEEDRDMVTARWAAGQQAHDPLYEAEYRLRAADGRWRWLLTRGRVMARDFEGAPLMTMGVTMDTSERKRAQNAIEIEKTRLRTLMETIPDLVWLKNPEGAYLYANPRFEATFGANPGGAVGRTDFDFSDRQRAAQYRDADRQVVESGRTLTFEEWVPDPRGGMRMLESIKAPLYDPAGQLLGVLGIGRDITDRKRIEDELQRALEAFNNLVSAIPAGVYRFRMPPDGNFSFDYVSPRWCEILGVTAEDVYRDARTAIDCVHPDDLPDFLAANRTARESGEPFQWEGRIRRKGLTRWIHIDSQPTRQANGELLWNGVQYDVTERRDAELRLRLAATVFDNAHEGICITDADERILEVNATFTEVTGYTREEALGRTPRMLHSGHQSPEFYAGMWAAIERDGHWRGELWNRRRNGELYAERLTISTVRDAAGRPTYFVGVLSDVTTTRRRHEQLERIAHYDVLTGIPNRVLLADRMRQATAHTLRHRSLLAVCYLDLDGFKPVNDRWGHAVGDRVLVEMAERLQGCLRGGDTVARIGGDEFVLLLGLEREDDVATAQRRILDAVSRPFTMNEQPVVLSASIGVTIYPNDDTDSELLLRHADQAMYVAKQEGRNRFHVYDPMTDRQAGTQRGLMVALERALERGELELHYQPIVNLRTGAVLGAEALLRWRHPERGVLLPEEFLPPIAHTDMMVRISDFVLDAALDRLADWQQAGRALVLGVNIGSRECEEPDFIAKLKRRLEGLSGPVAQGLELELAETAALQDLGCVARLIEACRDLDIGFAIDDFGTGYTSLGFLRRLAADTLKIDRSFIHDLLSDPDALALTEATIGLGHIFRRRVCAEGVENVEQAKVLLALGCEIAQGFGIAEPMPAAAFEAWLGSWPVAAWRELDAAAPARADLDLLVARKHHERWISMLCDYVGGMSDEMPTLDPHDCRFGAWLDAVGRRRYGAWPTFAEIAVVHDELHALGRHIVVLANEGRRAEAQVCIPALFALRDQLLDALHRLDGSAKLDA